MDPGCLIIVFENATGTCFACITLVLGQPAGLSKEVCLYSCADWIKLACQSEGGEGSVWHSLPFDYKNTGSVSRSTAAWADTGELVH